MSQQQSAEARNKYHIYSAIRLGISLPRMTKSPQCNFAIIQVLTFLNNPKNLDPSYKMDLDFWDCFVRLKLCLITEQMQYYLSCSDIVRFSCFALLCDNAEVGETPPSAEDRIMSLTCETEFVLFLAVLENSDLPMGRDSFSIDSE